MGTAWKKTPSNYFGSTEEPLAAMLSLFVAVQLSDLISKFKTSGRTVWYLNLKNHIRFTAIFRTETILFFRTTKPHDKMYRFLTCKYLTLYMFVT